MPVVDSGPLFQRSTSKFKPISDPCTFLSSSVTVGINSGPSDIDSSEPALSSLLVCCCSVVDGQCSADCYCLTDRLCCLCSDVRRFGTCVSSIKLEKTSFMVLLSGCCHVHGRYATYTHYMCTRYMCIVVRFRSVKFS